MLRSEGGGNQEPSPFAPFERVEEKAKALRGADEGPIRTLADAVFAASGLGEAPAGMTAPVRERLLRAEIDFRVGRRGGVPEENVVRVINGLAQKFNAPSTPRLIRPR